MEYRNKKKTMQEANLHGLKSGIKAMPILHISAKDCNSVIIYIRISSNKQTRELSKRVQELSQVCSKLNIKIFQTIIEGETNGRFYASGRNIWLEDFQKAYDLSLSTGYPILIRDDTRLQRSLEIQRDDLAKMEKQKQNKRLEKVTILTLISPKGSPSLKHSQAIKLGQKLSDKKPGRPKKRDQDLLDNVEKLINRGFSNRRIAKILDISHPTVGKIAEQLGYLSMP